MKTYYGIETRRSKSMVSGLFSMMAAVQSGSNFRITMMVLLVFMFGFTGMFFLEKNESRLSPG